MTPDQFLSWAQLGVAVATLLGFLKSWFNGTVRAALDAVNRIPSIEEKVDQQGQEIKDTRDAVIALSYGQQHDQLEVKPQELSDQLRGEHQTGPEQFLNETDRNSRAPPEDEEVEQ